VKGVMEFFSHQICPPDDELLSMMAAIGRQIVCFSTGLSSKSNSTRLRRWTPWEISRGIAHDFNNLLTVILCSAQLVLHRRSCDPFTAERVEESKRRRNGRRL